MTRLRRLQHLVGPLLLAASLLLARPAFAGAGDRVFDIVAPFEIEGLDPAVSGFVFQRMEIAETLIDVDGEGRPRPGLATAWTVSPDGLTWTLPLRAGVRFHDGTALTPDLAVASLERARGRPGILERAEIESIAARDGAVVFRLSRPFAPFWALLAHSSTIILAPASFRADGTLERIVGTGPYRVTRLEAPRRLEVEAFASYWGGKPAIEAASYLAIARGETRTRMVENGEADLAFQLDAPGMARLAANGATHVLKGPLPRVMQIKVNAALPPFDTIEGRTALSQAIQREGISRVVVGAPGTSASQLFPPSVAAWYDPSLPPLETDPERARAGLASLGWMPGEDGILAKDGKPLHVKLLTYADRPELPLVAAALRDQFSQVGIEVEVTVMDFAAIPEGQADGTLQLALVTRNYALVPEPFVTLLGDFRRGGSDWGSMNWDDPAYHEAMEALLTSGDAAGQEHLRRRIAAILQRDLPVIPVVWYEQSAAATKAAEGVAVDPFERSFGLSKMRWKP